MESIHRARRFGVWVVALTMVFRLLEIGIPQGLVMGLIRHVHTETETGQRVRSFSVRRMVPFLRESPPPRDVVRRPEFSAEEAQALRITDAAGAKPDLAAALTAPLEWSLAGEPPAVLILHTHTSESYARRNEDYKETAAYRTLDEAHNMLSIGDRVADLLEQAGIRVIHDREFHDYPSYNGAYTHARKSIQAALREHPEIRLILDLHRDAAESGSGQLRTHAQAEGQSCAQLMLVLGTGNNNLPNPRWQSNLAFAAKLQTVLERRCPGITRPISLRSQRFNQDNDACTLLVEIGAAGDSREEALLAAEQLAKAIISLKNGSITAKIS